MVVILIDDLGYGDLGCYGSEIKTPNIDALASEGVRFTNFHVNPMCSPTRASLLTGLNAHDVGAGWVSEADPGFPGYAMELTENAATLAEVLRDNGYRTLMSGKWHLCKPQDRSPGGNNSSWPVQRGFDEFYGILAGFTNFHHPDRLIEGNSFVDIDQYPDGYYLTDDLTDRAVRMIRETKAGDPSKPFFLYMSHAAVHAPLHAKPDDIAAQKGNYDMGWDRLREERFSRQKELGILPEAALAERNNEPGHEVEAWDDLTDKQRAVYARFMEVYAAMVTNTDANIGRLLAAIAELGELDNTIVIFTSDNGASREGEAEGSSQYYEVLPPLLVSDVDRDFDELDLIGGPQTMPHYPRGWAMACNTPLRLYKCSTHAGGHQVPMIMRWPEGVEGPGGIRAQYTHITDVMPTLLDAIGIESPAVRNGKRMKTPVGKSFRPTLATADAAPHHDSQYYELAGNRSMYVDGWEAVSIHYPNTSFSEEHWELFDLRSDPSQTNDVAAEHPERVEALKAAFDDAAHANQVYPLDEGAWIKMLLRPEGLESLTEPVTIFPGTPSLEHRRAGMLVQFKDFDVVVSLDFQPGDQGVLISHGDQGGGYMLSVENDELTFVQNGYGRMRSLPGVPLTAGPTEIRLSSTCADGNTTNIALSVDGAQVEAGEGFAMLSGIAPFQGIDVGIDRRSPVSWDIHQRHGTFPWTGTLHWARWEPGAPRPGSGADMIPILRKMASKYD